MTTVAKTEPILDEIETFEEAMNAIAAAGLDVHVINTTELVEDKDTLIGKPFLITAWRENQEGDFGAFVSVMAITQDNRRIVFNDGSSGIRLQLQELALKGIASRVLCKDGLRSSDFRFDEKSGDIVKRSDPRYADSKPAKTYYLS